MILDGRAIEPFLCWVSSSAHQRVAAIIMQVLQPRTDNSTPESQSTADSFVCQVYCICNNLLWQVSSSLRRASLSAIMARRTSNSRHYFLRASKAFTRLMVSG